MTASASDIATEARPSVRRNRAAWLKAADIAVVLFAIMLPWSTTFAAIFIVSWLVLLIPTAERRDISEILASPACWLPVLLFALALAGTLWATDIPWPARLHSAGQIAKLLAIPVLILHFEKSGRGLWVALGFLASCTAVMLASWLMFVDPRIVFAQTRSAGVPVKNYISQSQEFALCAFAVFGAAICLLRTERKAMAAFLTVLGIGFIASMVFVASSRTVLVCIPVLFVLFAIVYFNRRGSLILIAVAIAVSAVAWVSSPYLRGRTSMVVTEYDAYQGSNAATSTGQRLEFWRKSIEFIRSAPLAGHGTGAIRSLFERDAVGKTGASAEIIANPHNQTLGVAIQWGIIGVAVLYAMWFAHLMLFTGATGFAGWVGLVAVVENFVSSLFNSHLVDFTEGWIYVLAVGVAGGMVRLRQASASIPAGS